MRIRTLEVGLLVGFLSLCEAGTRMYINEHKSPENEVVERNNFGSPVFPLTVLMDTNNDGECDNVKTFLSGNRQMHLVYHNPSKEEKEVYKQYKTGEIK